MRREEDISFVRLQVVVECLDRFQVQMVGRSVQNEAVGIAQLHTGNHTTHLLTSGEYAYFLQHLFAGEKHTAEETFHIHFVSFAKLAQPVHQVEVGIEEIGIIQRQVSSGDGYPPVEGTGIRLHVSVDDFEERSHRTRVARQEYHFVTFLYVEIDVVEKHYAFLRLLAQSGNFQNLVARLTFGSEDDARILT